MDCFLVGLEKILLSLAIYTQPSKMSGNWLDLSSSSNRYIQTYMKGFLDMSGGNLLLRNNNIIVNSGDISLNGRIFVSNDASLSGRLFVSKDLSLNSRLFVGSDVSMNGNVYARGTIITDASSYTDVKGGFIVENNVNVTGIINQSTINLSGGYIYLPSNVTTEQYNTLVGSLAAVNNVIQTTYVGAVSSYGGGTVTRVGLPPYAGGPNIITQTMADNWVSGNLLVAGSTTLNTNQVTGGPGSLYVAGSVNVPNGNLVVGGNVSLLNNTLNMAIGNITLTGGNVTLNNGYIQTSGNIMTTNGTVHSANDISVNGLVFGKGPGGNNIVLGSTLLSTANVYTINNLALGKNSLTSISNNGSGTYGAFGSNNTTVGFSAGSGITYGNNNTVVGYNSGSGMTIGNNNTFLGGNTTTSSGAYAQSTAVGFGATIAGSNQVVLGTSTESVIVAGNVGIGRTGVPTYSLDVSGTINARGEIISSGCYFSQQYTYTTTAATTTYLKLGTVWGNFTEHVLTQYNTGYTGSLRIIVDAAQRAGLYLPNTPIQLISSIANNNCIITNVFIVAPTGGLTDTSIGELWIQVTSNSAGQTIVHSWRSMAATNHFNNTGTAIGTQTSTAMPPLITTTSPATATDYVVVATYTPNSATGSGGSTAFMGQKVGVGIAAPAYTLDVSGVGRFSSGATYTALASVSASNTPLVVSADTTGSYASDLGQIVISGKTNTALRLGMMIDTTNNIGKIQGGLSGTGTLPIALNPMGGNVGIGTGTTAPTYNLDVTGTGRFTSDVSINGNLVVGNLLVRGGLTVQQLQNQNIINTTTTNYQLIVTEDISMNGRLFVSGNIGIGTLAPNSPLNVIGSNTSVNNRQITVGSNYDVSSVNDRLGAVVFSNNNNNAEQARIESCCNVGGAGNNADLRFFTRLDFVTYNERMRIDRAGNVGIGTTAPSKMLTVAGDALINGITVGTGGGSSIYNVAIGYNVLSSNSLAISGVQNIAIGPNALTTNVNAYQNIAIGQNALTLANGTSGNGSQNVSVGVDAGKAITTGYQNAIFGSGSLNLTTTGGFNTAIGAFCANANITGSYNTYLGYGATANANNWSNSTAIGYNSVITGSNLIVLGTTAETTYVPGKLTSNSTLTANSDLATNGSYYSSQYTLAISTAGTTYYRIGYVGATYMEQVLTTEIAGQVGHIRITVDSTSWVGNNLTNVPIQITTSMSSSYTCIIQNVYVVYSNTAPSNQTNGELWIKVVSGGGGQTIYQSWNSKGTSGHYANMGTPIGNTSSTTMPPTGFTIKATYPINYTAGSGGATGFVGQNVGIGTASPGVTLDVAGRARIDTTASTTPYLTLGQVGGLTANTGLWCSGQIALAGRLYFYYNWAIYANNGGNMYFLYGGAPETGTGGAYVTAGGVWTNSDLKFKHSINDLSIGLKEVLKLRPVTYVLNLLPERGEQIGFIAQELQEQVPLVVEFDKDNDGLCVNYVQIIPVLAKAIQEQNVIVQELKSENADLKSRLNALEARLTAAGF